MQHHAVDERENCELTPIANASVNTAVAVNPGPEKLPQSKLEFWIMKTLVCFREMQAGSVLDQ